MNGLKVLVLGSSGMAGHVVTTYFEERGIHEVRNLARSRKLNQSTVLLDAADFAELGAFLDKGRFDVIINCIGILNQNAELQKDRAILLNSYLPHYLERRFGGDRTKIVHLSTDCVFSGKKGAYTETSFRDGDTSYDRTKALGEISGGRSLTIRTSIIGPDVREDGIGLFNWFMKCKGQINGYANAIWTGVTTIELAKAIERMIEADVSGIYHLVPGKSISKYELLLLLKEVFNRTDIAVARYDNDTLNKSLINTRKDFDYRVPDYKTMMVAMKEWIRDHRWLYGHYGAETL